MPESTADLSMVSVAGYERAVKLAEGGMGVVYQAFDPQLKRHVALKMIKADLVMSERLDRFRKEAEAVARLQHPHIVQVHGWHEHEGQPVLVLEYVSGGTLESRLRRQRLEPMESARLVAVLARAVQAAHDAGVVHRDLKPGNVLMAPPVEGNSGTVAGGFPKVTDFGLAYLANPEAVPEKSAVMMLAKGDCERMTATGGVVGTPAYMAPEQASGDVRAVGPAADVWALGVILYRCLAGRLPFAGGDMIEVLAGVRFNEPAALGAEVPKELAAVCMRCLRKDAAARPSAAELARELEEIAARPVRETRRVGWWVAAGVLVGVMLLVGWKVIGGGDRSADLGTPDVPPIVTPVVQQPVKPPVDPVVAVREKEMKQVADWQERVAKHITADEFEAAKKAAAEAATVYSRHLGEKNWQAADARLEAERWERLAKLSKEKVAGLRIAYGYARLARDHQLQREYAEAELPLRNALKGFEKRLEEGHPETARCCRELAIVLDLLGRNAEARALHDRATKHLKTAFAENHPETVKCYRAMASNLEAMGKFGEALPLRRQALKIAITTLGDRHPQTGSCYQGLGDTLRAMGQANEAMTQYKEAKRIFDATLGKENPDEIELLLRLAVGLMQTARFAEAFPLSKRAEELSVRIHGENDLKSATAMNQLAWCLQVQGKPTEALPLFRKALQIREKALGDQHPSVAASYNNLAACVSDQGKEADALLLYRQALLIREKVLGREHPNTAESYNNLAFCLHAQGNAAEALPWYRLALQIREKVLGKDHPDTASSYNNLASCLNALGRAAEALPLHRQALLIFEKVVGQEHPSTALSYNNVASCLQTQGKTAEALPLYRKALSIRQKVLGDAHPITARSYHDLASNLVEQKKDAEAKPLYEKALAISQKTLGTEHPDVAKNLRSLGLLAARRQEDKEAIRLLQAAVSAYEQARTNRAATGFERSQGKDGLSTASAALAVCLAKTGAAEDALSAAERGFGRGILDDFAGKKGKQDRSTFATLAEIQKRLPWDHALVFWLDVAELKEHWACVIRSIGPPVWQRLAGSGEGGSWREEDRNAIRQAFQILLDPRATEKGINTSLDRFKATRLSSLLPHFKETRKSPAVNQLIVVPVGEMGLLPVDVLTPDHIVSYVPSCTLFVRLMEKHRPVDGSSLLALGDPIFDKAPAPEPPSSGLFIKSVLPNSIASRAGLREGDVLLSIGESKLDSFDDLAGALSSLPANANVWRDGKTFAVRLLGSPLGAVFDKRSARAAFRAWWRDLGTTPQRGTGHKRLPGTRLEVEAISSMVKGSTMLVGSDASEQKLDELIDSGKMKDYRILHFSTHGELDAQSPGRSALILAQNKLPDPLVQVQAGRHPYDGRLTVSRIRERWTLDADLVVLSACETGLGKDAGGDGQLGFAHAFLSTGARSLISARWKIDDLATSLLMVRFYENLFGKRKGTQPMGRAEALQEAKQWLRNLTRTEAERLTTLHHSGMLRGSEGKERPPLRAKPIDFKGDRPFAHPYYWAAFTLIGDPD